MLTHVKNYRVKREKTLDNLNNQLELIKQKEEKLSHQKSVLSEQIGKIKSELALSDAEIDDLIVKRSVQNNVQPENSGKKSDKK